MRTAIWALGSSTACLKIAPFNLPPVEDRVAGPRPSSRVPGAPPREEPFGDELRDHCGGLCLPLTTGLVNFTDEVSLFAGELMDGNADDKFVGRCGEVTIFPPFDAFSGHPLW